MHSRRVRPTVRVLLDDLVDGWRDPEIPRCIARSDFDRLGAVSELEHPVLVKALDTFGPNGEFDSPEGLIRSATRYDLWELKVSQWRGGVWRDEDGVAWLVVAGLAKGDHQDHDDFYARVDRAHAGSGADAWLPGDEDRRLLRRETAARLRTRWLLSIQSDTAAALDQAVRDGEGTFEVEHPLAERVAADKVAVAGVYVAVGLARDDATSTDEVTVTVTPRSGYQGSDLWWTAVTRVLIAINPPEEDWDTSGSTFFALAEPGTWVARVKELAVMVAQGVLAESRPGEHAHYAHKRHLAGRTIEGQAARALCGVFFVPHRDPEKLTACPACVEELDRLPG